MGSSRYRAGYFIELRARDELREKGALVVRSSRSLTPADLVAFFPNKNEIWLVQCKAQEQAPKKKTTLQKRFANLAKLKGTYEVKAYAYMKGEKTYEFIEV